MTRFAVLAVVVASAGCALNRTPLIPEQDTGGFDAAVDGGMDAPIDVPPGVDTGIDTGPDVPGLDASFDGGVDTGIDSGMPDTGVDSGMPDTGVDSGMPDTGVDSGMPDTGVDAPPGRPTCDDLFDDQPNYMPCSTSGVASCRFYVRPSSGEIDCATACGSHTCMGAQRTSGDCTSDGTPSGTPCLNPSTERICICSRD